jgi:hypothetical protein
MDQHRHEPKIYRAPAGGLYRAVLQTRYRHRRYQQVRGGLAVRVRKQLDAQPDASRGHQLGGGFIHQLAVLDALHASFDRLLDRPRRIRMRGDVRGLIVGGFDSGA